MYRTIIEGWTELSIFIFMWVFPVYIMIIGDQPMRFFWLLWIIPATAIAVRSINYWVDCAYYFSKMVSALASAVGWINARFERS